jgi:hypothetical protein
MHCVFMQHIVYKFESGIKNIAHCQNAMCANYLPPPVIELRERFLVVRHLTAVAWKMETWPDYSAPFIVHQQSARVGVVGNFGFVPKRKIPTGAKKYSTSNAPAETVGTLRSLSGTRKAGPRCLVQSPCSPHENRCVVEFTALTILFRSICAANFAMASFPSAP